MEIYRYGNGPEEITFSPQKQVEDRRCIVYISDRLFPSITSALSQLEKLRSSNNIKNNLVYIAGYRIQNESGYPIKMICSQDYFEIIKSERVGTYSKILDSYSNPDFQKIFHALEQIKQLADFTIYYADNSAVRFKFAKPPSTLHAQKIAALILEVSPDILSEVSDVYSGNFAEEIIATSQAAIVFH